MSSNTTKVNDFSFLSFSFSFEFSFQEMQSDHESEKAVTIKTKLPEERDQFQRLSQFYPCLLQAKAHQLWTTRKQQQQKFILYLKKVWLSKNTNSTVTLFSTCTNPIIHLFHIPPPPQKKKIHRHCLISQEKLQTMIMQNFGGKKRCIMLFVQVKNWKKSQCTVAGPCIKSPFSESVPQPI